MCKCVQLEVQAQPKTLHLNRIGCTRSPTEDQTLWCRIERRVLFHVNSGIECIAVQGHSRFGPFACEDATTGRRLRAETHRCAVVNVKVCWPREGVICVCATSPTVAKSCVRATDLRVRGGEGRGSVCVRRYEDQHHRNKNEPTPRSPLPLPRSIQVRRQQGPALGTVEATPASA